MKYRFVLYPVYMSGPLLSSSTYYHFKDLAISLLANGHQVVFLAHSPDEVDFQHENLIVEEIPYGPDQYLGACQVPPVLEKYGRYIGMTPVDCLITSATAAVPLMRIQLGSYMIRFPPTPIGVFEVFPKFRKIHLVSTFYERLQSQGYSAADKVFLGGRADFVAIQDQLRTYLAPTQVRELIAGKRFDYEGFCVPRMEEQKYTLDPKSVVLFGRILANNNPEMLDLVANVFRSGMDVKLTMPMSATRQGQYIVAETRRSNRWRDLMDTIEFKFGCPRKDFLKLIGSAAFAVEIASRHNFPTAFLETVRLGTPCVAVDNDWIKHYVPDYPFLTGKDATEVMALSKFILHNPQKAREMVEPFRKKVIETYSMDAFHERIVGWAEGTCDEFYALDGARFRGYTGFVETIKEWQGGSIESARQFLKQNSNSGIVFGAGTTWTFVHPITTVVKLLIDAGFTRVFEDGGERWQS